eukprot:TRINITY_DN12332_c0_g1_i2.p1 TRINITY_DN12332_c0_g1~~TRINITY_DN12332_c0_g1_i2.p1  ORF type:complete len:491 (+),score=66.78 TRINITY_DN12332_c0_g1_i2:68-1474(+)
MAAAQQGAEAGGITRTPPTEKRGWLGGRLYDNPWREWRERGLKDLMRWQCGRALGTQGRQPSGDWVARNLPMARPPGREELRAPPPAGEVRAVWIGHATFLLQCEGFNVLTDPVYSERCSPVGFAGPQRMVPPSIRLEDLPPLHAVTISHNHYDHLCTYTVCRLLELGHKPRWYVPEGLEDWFVNAGVKRADVCPLTWWQQDTLPSPGGAALRVTGAPAQHWSFRGVGRGLDRCSSLWASFVLDFSAPCIAGGEPPECRVFVCGDTGYSQQMFLELGVNFAPVDLALIPIGAYCPRWFMRPQHIDPQEAVQLHIDLACRRSIPMHWGTFVLSDEPVDEPPRLLRDALEHRGVPAASFDRVKHGEVVTVRGRRRGEWRRPAPCSGGPQLSPEHRWRDFGAGFGTCTGCGKQFIMNRGCSVCRLKMCEGCFHNPFCHLTRPPAGSPPASPSPSPKRPATADRASGPRAAS